MTQVTNNIFSGSSLAIITLLAWCISKGWTFQFSSTASPQARQQVVERISFSAWNGHARRISEPTFFSHRPSEPLRRTVKLKMAEENSSAPTTATATIFDDKNSSTDSPYESGSHEELMYALGVNLARQFGDVSPLVEDGQELANLAKGVLDVLMGRIDQRKQGVLLMSRKDDVNNILVERSNKIREKLEKAGRSMLAQMKETKGANTLPSGVVVHSLEAGPDGNNGVRPSVSSSVKVHYHGTLPDGSVFDSSLDGEPAQFALNQVIPGWRDGLQKMHEGETAMLGIPPEVGYGEQGTPDGRIPGGATIFFKVQLLEVLTAGIGGSPKLFGADGRPAKASSGAQKGSGLLGADGRPL